MIKNVDTALILLNIDRSPTRHHFSTHSAALPKLRPFHSRSLSEGDDDEGVSCIVTYYHQMFIPSL